MLDINLIRDNPAIVKKDLEKRHQLDKLLWVEEIRRMDGEWKNLKQQVDELRHFRNKISQEIADVKKKGGDASKLKKQAAEVPTMILQKEGLQKELERQVNHYLMNLPNILHDSVPVGEGEEGNKLVKLFGKKPAFKHALKSHVDLLQDFQLADMERAAKISGARFWFLTGDLARLDLALQHYAVDFMVKRGFTLVQPPFMMNRSAYEGVTDLRDFEDVMYKIDQEDLYLIATSEHPLTAMFQNEILDEARLPMKMVGISTNFRKEAGAHGKDTKGIFRGHQFNKIEQIIICKPEDSWKFHEELIKNAIDFFISLGLHLRQINICTGDIGTVAAKKYDLEVWYPAQNAYREVVSCSNCTDYQARRLKIRYTAKDEQGKDVKIAVHTLNATCVATSRALVAILENFQEKDGSVSVPKILQPYIGGMKKIGRKKKEGHPMI
ncbi:serine--tRNA ligase [Candidatus Woesearchaeota archaeon]|nr:serine--tRNA ligase [Candidatus Woesearchaeota archaeon]